MFVGTIRSVALVYKGTLQEDFHNSFPASTSPFKRKIGHLYPLLSFPGEKKQDADGEVAIATEDTVGSFHSRQ